MIGRYRHPLTGTMRAGGRGATPGWGDAAEPAGSRVDGGCASQCAPWAPWTPGRPA